MAGLLYLVYNYAIFAFSVAMNPLTAMYIAIFGLALWSLLLGGREAVAGTEDLASRLNRRAAGGLLVAVGLLFSLFWLAQIAATSTTGILPPDLVKAGISANPVYALDLAFFLPLCALAGVGLLRQTSVAWAFPMLIWVPAAGDRAGVPVAVAITGLGVVASIFAAAAPVRSRPERHVLHGQAEGVRS